MDETFTPAAGLRRLAWGLWLATALVISAVVYPDPVSRSVTPNYHAAVTHWIAGEPLYNMAGSGFLYAPPSAIVFAPWSLIPAPWGDVLWRWTILGVLAAGTWRLTRRFSTDNRWWLAVTLASLATAAGCARNGQSTLLITGLMALAVDQILDRHWWRSAVLLVVAMAFKPVVLVMILLAAVLYPPLSWRLGLSLAVLFLAPFLTQSPGYVVSQYVAFRANSQTAYATGDTGYWAQFFGMAKVFGWDPAAGTRQALRLGFAAATCAACWLAARRLAAPRAAFYLFALANCYLMLFNSRTEGSTYAMVGPLYGLLMAEAWFARRNRPATIGYIAAIVITVFNYDLAKVITPPPREVWLAPFICTVITAVLVRRLWQELLGVGLQGTSSGTAGSGRAELQDGLLQKGTGGRLETSAAPLPRDRAAA